MGLGSAARASVATHGPSPSGNFHVAMPDCPHAALPVWGLMGWKERSPDRRGGERRPLFGSRDEAVRRDCMLRPLGQPPSRVSSVHDLLPAESGGRDCGSGLEEVNGFPARLKPRGAAAFLCRGLDLRALRARRFVYSRRLSRRGDYPQPRLRDDPLRLYRRRDAAFLLGIPLGVTGADA